MLNVWFSTSSNYPEKARVNRAWEAEFPSPKSTLSVPVVLILEWASEYLKGLQKHRFLIPTSRFSDVM